MTPKLSVSRTAKLGRLASIFRVSLGFFVALMAVIGISQDARATGSSWSPSCVTNAVCPAIQVGDNAARLDVNRDCRIDDADRQAARRLV